ncbi:MAG: SGNH/GDSL hydrolase family protein [Bacteroidia bacterium]|nr:SGNH/GDSL hydrolase family protein [Bacteroidia bacterium]
MNLRYWLGTIIATPLLPIMAMQGKRIRKAVPPLPPAEGPQGSASFPSDDHLRLLAIGESTIAGFGVATHEEGFTGTLARELSAMLASNVTWRVYARGGYTADRVRLKIIPKIEEEQADLIVVGLGGNDAFTLNRPWRWRAHIRKLILAIRERFPDSPIIFTNMPPIKEFPAFTPLIKWVVGNLVEILGNELTKEVSEHENVFYSAEIITMKGWLRKRNMSGQVSDFFSDGVHPSLITYQVWAKDLAEFVVANKIVTFPPNQR